MSDRVDKILESMKETGRGFYATIGMCALASTVIR